MKISTLHDNLQKATSLVSRVVGSRTSLPILANILLKADKSTLELSATNLEIALTARIGCKAEQTGQVCVPAKLLLETIQGLQSDKLTLSGDETKLELAAAGAEVQIQATSAQEFPAIPEIKDAVKLSLSRDQVIESFTKVAVAASLDESRPVLAGVVLRNQSGELILAATDSYRLAEAKLSGVKADDFAVILPLRTVQEILRLVGAITEAQDIDFEFGKSEAQVTIDSVQLVTRLIDGNFPNYQQIIPDQFGTTIRCARNELMQAAKLAGIFARESAHTITMKVMSDKLLLHAEAAQVGENTSEVSIQLNGAEAEISLNVRFLIDALNVIPTEEVELKLNDKLDPCVVVPHKPDSPYVHLIMPLRS